MVRGVATHLMFAGEASAALELYAAVFPEFCLDRVERYGSQRLIRPSPNSPRAARSSCR